MKDKRCEADSSEMQASYGNKTDDLVRFCKPHSRDGDVSLAKLRCMAPGCDGPHSWGTAAGGVALPAHCKEHRGQALTSRRVLRAAPWRDGPGQQAAKAQFQ